MSKSYYIESGNSVNVESADSVTVHDVLPVGTYIAKQNPANNRFYLQRTIDMEVPSRVYGVSQSTKVNRVVNTYFSRSKSTGVLLVGDKGSGKTLLSKMISKEMRSKGVPTIIVNEPLCGQEFNTLITNISQDVVIIFDEFEKVYDKEDQKHILTLLDGTIETKKLFILTTNSRYVDTHMINRPGRIFYTFEYSGLDSSFVTEYANDILIKKDDIAQLTNIVDNFSSFTFDMLQALVEEMNRYGECAKEAIKYLNINLNDDIQNTKTIKLLLNGVEIKNSFYPMATSNNPLLGSVGIDIYDADKNGITPPKFMSEDMINTVFGGRFVINSDNLDKITSGGVMHFKIKSPNTDDVITVIVARQQEQNFNYLFDAM